MLLMFAHGDMTLHVEISVNSKPEQTNKNHAF